MTTIREALEVFKKAQCCEIETTNVSCLYGSDYVTTVKIFISDNTDLDCDYDITSNSRSNSDSGVKIHDNSGFKFYYNHGSNAIEKVRNTINGFYGSVYGYYIPEVKKIIYNGPATIVFWTDETKTVVKMQLDEPKYDPDKAFAMAVCKKAFGNKFNKHLTQAQKAHLEACDKLFYENVKAYYPEFFDRLTDIAEVPKVPMKEY